VLPLLGAIVTDRGGQLSHAAIVAREYGIPCVVGTREATIKVSDGARVRVDGPKGPHQQEKAGAVFLARKTGVPLIPVGAAFVPSVRLGWLWDQSYFPLPFSRVSVVVGDPIEVDRSGGDETISAEQVRVRDLLIALGDRADRVGYDGATDEAGAQGRQPESIVAPARLRKPRPGERPAAG
jgi:1-acyl-sn-glycerol-3-phosphate acyltransferase